MEHSTFADAGQLAVLASSRPVPVLLVVALLVAIYRAIAKLLDDPAKRNPLPDVPVINLQDGDLERAVGEYIQDAPRLLRRGREEVSQ